MTRTECIDRLLGLQETVSGKDSGALWLAIGALVNDASIDDTTYRKVLGRRFDALYDIFTDCACPELKVSKDELKSKIRDYKTAAVRSLFVYQLISEGYRIDEVAALFRRHRTTAYHCMKIINTARNYPKCDIVLSGAYKVFAERLQ